MTVYYQRLAALLAVLFFAGTLHAQHSETYGLKDPGPGRDLLCGTLVRTLQELPAEENYSLQVKDGEVVFVLTDGQFLERLFDNDSTGLAVDILEKDQFPCGGDNRLPASSLHRGTLLQPLYRKELKARMKTAADGVVQINIGPLPAQFAGKEVELNLLLLQRKYLCHYNLFYNVPYLKWDLLKMGLYRDTVVPGKNAGPEGKESFTLTSQKELRFVIPFEKDKYEYKPEHIRPLYDSLRLSDYIIRKINIRAYSSVEGPTERNIMLQNKRAESIVQALQSFQKTAILPEVSAAENWVEFLQDIEGTSFAGLADVSKQEVKEKLKDEAFSAAMENILQKHRKGVVVMELEKKTQYTLSDPAGMKEDYKAAIRNRDMTAALALQSAILTKIKNREIPEDFIRSVEMPFTAEYGNLHANQAAFRFELHPEELDTAIAAFLKLQALLPDHAQMTYNLSVLQLQSWLKEEQSVDKAALLVQIKRLSARGIDKTLAKRLMVNYHMIESDYLMNVKDYAGKDRALRFTHDNYRFLRLSNSDVFNLAKYFSNYGEFDWAVRMLNDYVKQVNADEEALFLYLNLTIIYPPRTRYRIYRAIMENAIGTNEERFCRMFSANHSGGITFQLLGDDKLKRTYCENCD